MTVPPQQALLPIDIHYSKFLYWLVDRKRIPSKWASNLNTARTLARTALSATPSHLHPSLHILPTFSSQTSISYINARSILQRLISPQNPPAQWPSADKDLLGRYKSPIIRAWSDAVNAFQNAHIYLADAAQLLTHNTNNEAPAIKATIATLNRHIADFTRRESQTIRSAAEATKRYKHALKDFNLVEHKLSDFQNQLTQQVDIQVPLTLQKAVACTRSHVFASAVEYYTNFALYVAAHNNQLHFDVLNHVMTDDIQALTKKPNKPHFVNVINTPSTALADQSAVTVASTNQNHEIAELDWGIEIDHTGTDADDAQSNTQITTETPSLQTPDATITAKANDHQLLSAQNSYSEQPDGGAIDWSAAMGVLELVEEHKNVHSQQHALTLADAPTRDIYLHNLVELDAFLMQRLTEMEKLANSEMGLVLQQSNCAPAHIRNVGVEQVDGMRNAVQEAIEAINSADTIRLLALQSNSNLLERTAKGVLEKKHTAERMRGAIDALRRQRASAAAQITTEVEKKEKLAEETTQLKKDTEEALSRLYQGRKVNIVGEINVIFPSMTEVGV